jgi:hypothetical protein
LPAAAHRGVPWRRPVRRGRGAGIEIDVPSAQGLFLPFLPPPGDEQKKFNLFQLNRLLFSFGRYIVHSSALHNKANNLEWQQAKR